MPGASPVVFPSLGDKLMAPDPNKMVPESHDTMDTPSLLAPSPDERRQLYADHGPRAAASSKATEKPRTAPFYHVLQEWWVWELTCLVVAFAMFAVYYYLLRVFDTRPVSEWPKSYTYITLNSFVSFITTVMRGAILSAIAPALGQLKWHAFRKSRSLETVETFDTATRGFFGSLLLVLSPWIKSLAAVGALLLMATVPLSTVVQASIATTIGKSQNQTFGSLPVTNSYTVGTAWAWKVPENGTKEEAMPGWLWPGYQMMSALKSSWFYWTADTSVIQSILEVTCPSGYCEYINATTLAVDYECLPVDDIEEVDAIGASSTQLGISSMLYIDTDDVPWATSLRMVPSFNTSEMSGSGLDLSVPLIGRVAILALVNDTTLNDNIWEGVECSLFWTALRSPNQTLSNNTLSGEWQYSWSTPTEEVVYQAETDIVLEPDWPWTCKFSDTETDCRFTVSWQAHRGIQNFLGSFWNNYMYYDGEENSDEYIVTDDAETEVLSRKLQYDRNLTATMIDYMWSMSRYMSNNVRIQSSNISDIPGQTFVWGEMYDLVLFFDMRPGFAAYPFALLFATTLFVSTTIFLSRKQPLWKNSQLALLFHGFPDNDKLVTHTDFRKIAAMHQVAEHMHVVLTDEHDDAGLRLRRTAGRATLWNTEQEASVEEMKRASAGEEGITLSEIPLIPWKQGEY